MLLGGGTQTSQALLHESGETSRWSTLVVCRLCATSRFLPPSLGRAQLGIGGGTQLRLDQKVRHQSEARTSHVADERLARVLSGTRKHRPRMEHAIAFA